MAASSKEDDLTKRRRSMSSQREGFGPSGRPLDYQGSQNWTTRIITRTLSGATVGVLAGAGIGIFKKQNPLRWLTSVGANCSIATCCFCCFQELTRELRAADPDDWVNCFLGGLASGGLLGRLHGGPARALPTALLFASVGTGLHLGGIFLAEYRMRHFLADKLSEQVPADPAVHGERKLSSWFDFELPEWSPIKKLDEEEAKKRVLDRERRRQRALHSLQTGSFPVDED